MSLANMSGGTTAQRLKALRERSGFSVRGLASELGMQASRYQYYEDKFKRDCLPMELVMKLIPVMESKGIPKEDTLKLSVPVSEPTEVTAHDIVTTKSSRQEVIHAGSSIPWAPGPVNLPVLGAAVGGVHGIFVDNGEFLEMTARPDNLLNVPKAYAAYVYGDSMEPRFQAGELVHVNPNMPPHQGNDVIYREQRGDETHYFVKKFISQNDKTVELEQHNPRKRLSVAKNKISDLHVIVGVKFR